jgi:hypothetical protein
LVEEQTWGVGGVMGLGWSKGGENRVRLSTGLGGEIDSGRRFNFEARRGGASRVESSPLALRNAT